MAQPLDMTDEEWVKELASKLDSVGIILGTVVTFDEEDKETGEKLYPCFLKKDLSGFYGWSWWDIREFNKKLIDGEYSSEKGPTMEDLFFFFAAKSEADRLEEFRDKIEKYFKGKNILKDEKNHIYFSQMCLKHIAPWMIHVGITPQEFFEKVDEMDYSLQERIREVKAPPAREVWTVWAW